MKNLLYIGNELEPRGGAPTSIDRLTPLLKKEGFEVKTSSAKENQLLRLSEMMTSIIRNKSWADVVLIDTYSTRNFWYAVLTAELCSKLELDYILLLHGGDLPGRLKSNPKLSASLFKKAKLNIAPSRYLFKVFQQAGFVNIIYIPNSIFLKDYSFKIRKVIKPKLFWVRAFAEIYNPMLAIKVLEELLKEYPEAELCMVGPEKDESYKECLNYAESNKLPVKFPGKLAKQEWTDLSKEYDIFLNTTNVDNTPVSLIEAMALGLPIISTNVGGIPYLLQDQGTGLLVSPNDKKAMLDAIKKLLQNTELTENLSQNARHQSQKFDWEIVKEEWKKVLR
ncbi:glycosyltransferase family 4 protein [Salegentibacter salarius]|uniref:Glycosyl transferase family 1 n=1 Tax=Salegentibacter salarius TaxID=435906 RepID=A0A2N0TQ81_9FLAO|nr:glycosyltransferase family 4 protein [Salegentibacter salarius]OEY71641.1 glycosyl transferase family 1 [Salegentibacter salarius]PKD16891.1 glycosyl transferase family 1 [Salegentibacter salarius]SLJ90913.1 Glycosyltransferase involved in cell wall bisynthesis [Salegentibacter salarius]